MKTNFGTAKYTKYTKRLLVCFVYFVVNSLFAATTLNRMPGTNEVYTAAETDAAIVRLAPAPGNYAAVSNAAMNAVQPGDLANAAQSATNYTDTAIAAATNNIPRPDMTGYVRQDEDGAVTLKKNGDANGAIIFAPSDGFPYPYIRVKNPNSTEAHVYVGDGIEINDNPNAGRQVCIRGDWTGSIDIGFDTTVGQDVPHISANGTNILPIVFGAATTNDVTLTPVYSKWVITPPSLGAIVIWQQGYWCIDFEEYGALISSGNDDPNATTIQCAVGNIEYTASRSFIGYTLGAQADKVLAATNNLVKTQTLTNYYTKAEADDAIDARATPAAAATIATNAADYAVSTADTSYPRFTAPTNLNQTVQYMTTPPGGVLSVEIPANGDTKDWIVYAYCGEDTPLVLPAAIWWMADEAYTNAIPSNTPTALYFSQVADGIFTLSRQELKSVEIVAP